MYMLKTEKGNAERQTSLGVASVNLCNSGFWGTVVAKKSNGERAKKKIKIWFTTFLHTIQLYHSLN